MKKSIAIVLMIIFTTCISCVPGARRVPLFEERGPLPPRPNSTNTIPTAPNSGDNGSSSTSDPTTSGSAFSRPPQQQPTESSSGPQDIVPYQIKSKEVEVSIIGPLSPSVTVYFEAVDIKGNDYSERFSRYSGRIAINSIKKSKDTWETQIEVSNDLNCDLNFGGYFALNGTVISTPGYGGSYNIPNRGFLSKAKEIFTTKLTIYKELEYLKDKLTFEYYGTYTDCKK